MKFLLILLVGALGLSLADASDGFERFENYKVYNVFVNSREHLNIFTQLNKKYAIHLLRAGTENVLPFSLAVGPSQYANFEKDLLEKGISFNMIDENLQETLDSRRSPNENFLFQKPQQMDWTQYHNLSTINHWMWKISRENDFITRRFIGFSAQNRPMYALIVSKNPNNKAIFIESNIHAIEWISSAVSTCFLNHLISTKSDLLEKYDFVFIPIMNPDGFHYTHTKNPLWRKNRRYAGFRNSSGLCYGIDLNRNFDSYWGQNGYNLDVPCDHFYAGRRPETEPEVRNAIRFEKSLPKRYVRMQLVLHSYGQLVLLPYGHTDELIPDNIDEMMAISEAFANAAKARHGTDYKFGSSGKLLGYVSGAAKDYWYDQGVRYSATVELRDRGQYGFFLPAKEIIPTCEEATDGIIAMIAAAQERGLFD